MDPVLSATPQGHSDILLPRTVQSQATELETVTCTERDHVGILMLLSGLIVGTLFNDPRN
jgi:hypothetical protein